MTDVVVELSKTFPLEPVFGSLTALQRQRISDACFLIDGARQLLREIPITQQELRRLRNRREITFDKQADAVATCLIRLRELLLPDNQ